MRIANFVCGIFLLLGALSVYADDLDGEREQPVFLPPPPTQSESAPQLQRRNTYAQNRPQRQAPPAPVPQYQEDVFEQMRNLNGRIDSVENQVSQINAAGQGDKDFIAKTKKDLEQKFVGYEEALKSLETKVASLTDELAKMKEDLAKKEQKSEKEKSDAKGSAKKGPNTAYDEGEQLLGQKKWREAIIAFEDYRKNNPKGKHYADATYKIGVCMQEVGMKAEAKLFYDEVIAKFPGSKEAKKATYRLKTVK